MTIKFSADPGLLTSLFKVLVASTKKWKSLAQVWRGLVEVTPQLLCDYPSQASLVCPIEPQLYLQSQEQIYRFAAVPALRETARSIVLESEEPP